MKFVYLTALLACCGTVYGEAVVGGYAPALSPDGSTLLFCYHGDIWKVAAEGGRAIALTDHIAYDASPVWSPDGTKIAFYSNRNGSADIFLMTADGDDIRQLTFSSSGEAPTAWSPDGTEILFGARREGAKQELFSVNVDTLMTKKYGEDFAGMAFSTFAPDGNSILYSRFGFPWTRPRYFGSGAYQINSLDIQTGVCTTLVNDEKQHLWSQYLPGGEEILTVTYGERTPGTPCLGESLPKNVDNASRTPNLWIFDKNGQGRQITQFVGDAVRQPTVAKNGDIVFAYDIDLYRLKAGETKAQKIEIQIGGDEKVSNRQTLKIDDTGVSELAVSADGQQVFFGLRHEIWQTKAQKPGGVEGRSARIAKRLTDWVGEDNDFIVSGEPNPSKLYFCSDREKNIRLYELDLASDSITCLWNRTEDMLSPQLSPDGRAIAFWVTGAEGGLYRMNLGDKSIVKLVSLPASYLYGNGGLDFSWSPDSKWIAYTAPVFRSDYNIFIVGSEGGTPINVTRLNAVHGSPTWSVDGKYLYFISNRDGEALYILPLMDDSATLVDAEMQFKPVQGPVTVKIDFDRIDRRIRKHSGVTGISSTMYSVASGELYFISDGCLTSLSYDGKSLVRQVNGGGQGNLVFAPLQQKFFFTDSAGIIFAKVAKPNTPLERINFTAYYERNIADERMAAFAQLWRNYKRGFYDPNMHARDWDAIRARYERLMPSVGTSEEFGILLNRMVGELESSHSEITAAATQGFAAPSTPRMGFMIDYTWQGPGIRVAEVPENAPGDYPSTQIKAGEYIMEINGEDVLPNELLYKQISNKPQDFTFLVNDEPVKEGAHIVKYSVLNGTAWNNLLYWNMIEKNRARVKANSNDRLGYVRIYAMGAEDQVKFEREVYDRIVGKEGVIIDVRGNRGGNVSDTLISWLLRRPHEYVKSRDGAIQQVPERTWAKPIIVLSDQQSYSNGECFTTSIRANKLGKVVGMPTPGYVIWTYSMGLVDGTSARMPLRGAWRMDGSPTENSGEQPDIRVEYTAEDYRLGRDPQLDVAIEELLKEIDAK